MREFEGEFAERLSRWYSHAEPTDEERAASIARIRDGREVRRHHLPDARRPGIAIGGVIGLLVAASVALVLWQGRLATGARETAAIAAGAPGVPVELRLTAPTARRVAVAGDFNAWNVTTTLMHRDPVSDEWRVTIVLPPGRHVYTYLLDGTRWVVDSLAPQTTADDLGAANVVAVPFTPGTHD